MSSFNVWFGSLSAYNAGYLKGEWLRLPMAKKKLRKIYQKYSCNGVGDVYIADSEAPIEVKETQDIFQLNEIAKAYEELNDEDRTRVAYLMKNCNYTWEQATENIDDVRLTEFTCLKQLAMHLVDEGCYGQIPDAIAGYIDYEAIARDLELGGQYDATDDGQIVELIY